MPKFHTYPHSLLGLSELSVRFHNWNGVYIGVLHLGSTQRLQLVLHSLALRDVVTIWVESVFILDRNEGLEVFLKILLGFIAIFSFFHRVGTGHIFLCSMWHSPSVGCITCRMFFPFSSAPFAFSLRVQLPEWSVQPFIAISCRSVLGCLSFLIAARTLR